MSEAITQAELTEVLAGCAPEGGGSLVFMAPPERVAAEIFEEARLNREPEYERGQFYQDARGSVFFCLLGEGPRPSWSTMPEGKPYPHDYPRRPLRKLVPEAGRSDLEAKLDQIVAICRNPAAAVGEVMGPGRHVPGDRLAARILAIIGGGEAVR